MRKIRPEWILFGIFAAIIILLTISISVHSETWMTEPDDTVIIFRREEGQIIVPQVQQEQTLEEMLHESMEADMDEKAAPFTYELLDEYEQYLLARIAMAEAEDEDLEGKALVMNVVLNRIESDEFPSTVEDVIFQKNQFAPIRNGRWERVEPNDECYEALDMVMNGWDESCDALYFELYTGESNWHRDNLDWLFKHGCHDFYR